MRLGAAVAVLLLAIGVVSAQTVVPTDVLYFKQSPNYCLAFDDAGAGGKTELYADTNCNDTYDGSDFYLSTPSGVAQIGSCPTTGTGYQPQIGVQGSGAPDCMIASDAPPNGISAGGNEMMVTNTAGSQISSSPRVGYDSVLAGLKVYNAGETNSTTYYTDNNQSRIYYAAAGAPDNPFVLETQFATIEMRPCTDGTCAVDGPQVEIYGRLYVDGPFTATESISVSTEATLSGTINHDGSTAGFYGVTPVVQPTALTSGLTTITHTAPGTPDYAIQDMTNTGPYGFETQDEGNTVLSVIANLQTRVNDLESRLEDVGLLATQEVGVMRGVKLQGVKIQM